MDAAPIGGTPIDGAPIGDAPIGGAPTGGPAACGPPAFGAPCVDDLEALVEILDEDVRRLPGERLLHPVPRLGLAGFGGGAACGNSASGGEGQGRRAHRQGGWFVEG